MKSVSNIFKILTIFLMILAVVIFAAIFVADGASEQEYKVISNSDLKINCAVPLSVTRCDDISVDSKLYNTVGSKYNVELKIFGIIPVKKVSVEIVDDMYVSVLGLPFGMKIYTEGVLVIDISDVDAKGGYQKPAELAGLKIGDFILSVNGQKVYTNEDVAALIEESNGKQMKFVIRRDNVIKNITLKPLLSQSTGSYKAGIWVRDSSAGIGTLTFYCPANDVLCGLGHSVTDSDTGKVLTINSGEIVGAEIVSYTRAEKGAPGELHGRILPTKYADFSLNCAAGVYGKCNNALSGEMMQVALKQEISNGDAYILSTVDGAIPKKYKCKVSIIKSNTKTQNLLVEITDDTLLKITGGIVQGMSGSPIIQNGKLIGAVTHVLIDEPNKGYGIFAENMLETAQTVGDCANKSRLQEVS